MKRIKYLVIGFNDLEDSWEHYIVEAVDHDTALKLAEEDLGHDLLDPTVLIHKDIKRIVEPATTIMDLIKQSHPNDFIKGCAKTFVNMAINKKVDLITFESLLSPFVMLSHTNVGTFSGEHKPFRGRVICNEDTIGDRKRRLLRMRFRYLPKNSNILGFKDDQNYELYIKSTGIDENKSLYVVHRSGRRITLPEFFYEFKYIIPDLPLRFEKVMIENM